MDETTPKEDLIRYLLGHLPEAEADALEVRLLTDSEVIEAMQEAEYELMDRYARGQLPAAQRTRFETHYLASPLHLERYAVARHLTRAADATPLSLAEPIKPRAVNASSSTASTGWCRTLFAAPAFAWSTALAFAVLSALAVWLLIERGRLLNQLQVQRQHSLNLESEITQLRQRTEPLLVQKPTASPTPVASASDGSPEKSAKVFAFSLSPLLVRSGAAPQQLVIPREATQVSLMMKGEPDTTLQYQIVLRTVKGATVLTQRGLRAHGAKANLGVSLPVAKLPPGDYLLTLFMIINADEVEELNQYFFRVPLQKR